MTKNNQPIYILPEGTQRSTGKSAQRTNIIAAKMVAETVKSTLGPKGMDKMIVDSLGDVVITNDGVTILDEMQIEHPIAKMIVEVAKTQEDEVGDGTTTSVIFAGELLKKAENLLDKNIHPTVIMKGYNLAAEKSQEILNSIAKDVSKQDMDILDKIAMTAMTGKGAEGSKELLANLVVHAVTSVALKDNLIDINDIKIEKKVGAGIDESELIKGIVIDKKITYSNMPKKSKDAVIALINSSIEVQGSDIETKIQINKPEQIQAFAEQEERMIKNMVESIYSSGASVVFCSKNINDLAQHFLFKKGIIAIKHVKQSDMESLSKATGANIITKIDDLDKKDLGSAGLFNEINVGDEKMICVSQCKNPKFVTLLVRGGTEHVVDEIKRAIDDAVGDIVSALKVGKVVAGAGATEIELSKELRKFASSLKGREQLAAEAFADAVEVIPITLAENAGLDSINVLTELKQAHDEGKYQAGIDVFTGKVVDAWEMGVIEPLKIKTQAIKSAAEVAGLILRIDDVIAGENIDNK